VSRGPGASDGGDLATGVDEADGVVEVVRDEDAAAVCDGAGFEECDGTRFEEE